MTTFTSVKNICTFEKQSEKQPSRHSSEYFAASGARSSTDEMSSSDVQGESSSSNSYTSESQMKRSIGGSSTSVPIQPNSASNTDLDGSSPWTSTSDASSACEPFSVSNTKYESEKPSFCERLQRSRERNRVHARKTRQRKKEQMQSLQTRAEELKKEHIRLKQVINEKTTAKILLGLLSLSGENENNAMEEDPRVEMLLRRPVEEIPDASKITELPALILPGQHNSRKAKLVATEHQADHCRGDGIDYELLGKDRAQCSPEELDRIRRERNRMHAKRTRDRKRLFMEEMTEMCKQIERDNSVLREHLAGLDGENASSSPSDVPSVSPLAAVRSVSSDKESPTPVLSVSGVSTTNEEPIGNIKKRNMRDHIVTLLEVAGAFDMSSTAAAPKASYGMSTASAVSASTNSTSCEGSCDGQDDSSNVSPYPASKRRRCVGGKTKRLQSNVPSSITTSPTTIGM